MHGKVNISIVRCGIEVGQTGVDLGLIDQAVPGTIVGRYVLPVDDEGLARFLRMAPGQFNGKDVLLKLRHGGTEFRRRLCGWVHELR